MALIEGGETLNNVSIVGRLTKAPEVRTVADGKSVGRFTLAVNRNFKNQQGENDVDFILCTAWGKLAEHMVKYCGKGSQVGVIGRLQSRNYTNDEGKRIYITDVLALEVRFLQLKSPEPTVKVEDFQLPAAFTAQQPMQ